MKKFLLFIFSILAIFLNSQVVLAENKHVKFVQVSDIHYLTRNDYIQEKIKALVDNINNLKNVDFVVFTGDNIDFANSEYLQEFLSQVEGIRVPCYFVIGNHDVSEFDGLNKEKYMQIVHSYNKNHPTNVGNYTFKKNGILFVVVDGAKQKIPSANGYYRKETLEWLDKTLSENINSPVIILQHFPVYVPEIKNDILPYKVENYIGVIDKYENINAIISGHIHTNKEVMCNGIYHLTAPAFCDEPHYYKIIDVIVGKDILPMVFTDLQTIDSNLE